MIYDCAPWKCDLIWYKKLILQHNKAGEWESDFDEVYTIIEKAIFYSAFIIRKLIDCDRLSTDADEWMITVLKYRALCEFTRVNHDIDEDSHDWEHKYVEIVKAHDVCNWLIHSYIFLPILNDRDTMKSFVVASDYDRNDVLYEIDLEDWMRYMEFVALDSIIDIKRAAKQVKLNKNKTVLEVISEYKKRG